MDQMKLKNTALRLFRRKTSSNWNRGDDINNCLEALVAKNMTIIEKLKEVTLKKLDRIKSTLTSIVSTS